MPRLGLFKHLLEPEDAQTPTFTIFPKHPVEIRRQIWEHVSFQPGNLDIWTQFLGQLSFDRAGPLTEAHEFAGDEMFRFLTTRSPPAILHTNREARSVGLRFFHPDFGIDVAMDRRNSILLPLPAKIYPQRLRRPTTSDGRDRQLAGARAAVLEDSALVRV